jgi:hypothetical protein
MLLKYDCLNCSGSCEVVPKSEYCEACFVRSCLLLLDLTDDIYFKMWRAVPPHAKNYVPTKPPVVKRYPNRGKVLFIDHRSGSIVNICPLKIKPVPQEAKKIQELPKNGSKGKLRNLQRFKMPPHKHSK